MRSGGGASKMVNATLQVNGRARRCQVAPGMTLLEALRGPLGLTGTKCGCAAGDCGTCTVLFDGKAVKSCLVLAVEAEGHEVTTIEGLAGPGVDPVQTAFLEHSALQCGFCTPGMVMAATGFLRENPDPTEAEVRAVLAGNLCRCTGYVKIVEAVLDAAERIRTAGQVGAAKAADAARGESMKLTACGESSRPTTGHETGLAAAAGQPQARGGGQLSIIGRSIPRLDGPAKVTGQALYVDDLSLPGMAYARAVRSPYAHALVRAIDATAARAMPGVVAVLTAADVPGANFCRGFKDQPVLVGHKVRFLGEAVALVVAETQAQAAEATTAVKVDYEVLPGCFDPEKALLPDAPDVAENGNLCVERHLHRGDFEAALRQAAVVVTNTYRVPTVDHVFLEPHGALAAPTPEGLTVWTSTRMVDSVGPTIARMLALPPDKVRIIAPAVGGSFGGKPDSPCTAMTALAAFRTGRPVKLVYDREETMQVSVKRHACVIECTHAADADGKLLGAKIDVLANAGAYTADSPGVVGKHIHHGSGPYYIPSVEIRSRAVFTNLPVTGAMRGYGVPQIAFAVELQMDALAEKLGLDPIEIRLRNVLRPGQTMATGQEVPEGTAAEACLLRLRELLEREKEAEAKAAAATTNRPARAGKRSAWGVAFSFYGNGAGAGDTGRCRLRRESGGTYTLYVGIPDVGQGSTTALAQIACQELGIPWDALKVVTADTATTPPTGPAAATRVTVIVGRAVQAACREMKEKIAGRTGGPPSAVRSSPRARSEGPLEPLEVSAEFQADSTPLDENGQGKPYITYTYAAHAAKVAVDGGTGQAAVEKVLAVYDTGAVINPPLYEGQSEGSVAGGAGYALFEEIVMDEGRVLNPSLHTYLIPTALDAPRVVTCTVPSSDGQGPFAAKGIGEPAIIPAAPAVASALHAVTGLRFTSLPVTAERIRRRPAGGER